MADKVTVQVLGGTPQVLDGIRTVAEAKAKVNATNHSASVNGESANDCFVLDDYSYVTLSPAVKGG